jgi:hypothetical protein
MSYHADRLRIRAGWGDSGRQGTRIGPDVVLEQSWTPIKWDDEDDPDWHKTTGLEPEPQAKGAVQSPKVAGTAERLRATESAFARTVVRVVNGRTAGQPLDDDVFEDRIVEAVGLMFDALLFHHNAVEAEKARQRAVPPKEPELAGSWGAVEVDFVNKVMDKASREGGTWVGHAEDERVFAEGVVFAFRNIRLAKALPE